jgi:hypothetical protein
VRLGEGFLGRVGEKLRPSWERLPMGDEGMVRGAGLGEAHVREEEGRGDGGRRLGREGGGGGGARRRAGEGGRLVLREDGRADPAEAGA